MKTKRKSVTKFKTAHKNKLNFLAPPLILLSAAILFPVSADLLLDNGFEKGSADWSDSGPWKKVPANAISSSNAREGSKSVQFLSTSGHKRSEFVLRNGKGTYKWGEEYWVGFSLNVLDAPDGYNIISQHHSAPHLKPDGRSSDWSCGAGGNSFTILAKNGNFDIRTSTNPAYVKKKKNGKGNALWGAEKVSKAYQLKKWHDFVLHFKYATDNTGFMEVWLDGKKVVNKHNTPSVYLYDSCNKPKAPHQYQKIGSYYGFPASWNKAHAGEILYDAFRIGDKNSSYKEVAPKGGVSPEKDTQAPSSPTSVTATQITKTSLFLSWRNSPDNVDVTGYEVFANGKKVKTIPANIHRVQLTNLTPNLNYSLTVRAKDAAGNLSAFSDPETAVTDAPEKTPVKDVTPVLGTPMPIVSIPVAPSNPEPDLTPPIVTNVKSVVEGLTATITWDTDKPTNSYLQYSYHRAVGAGGRELVKKHRVEIEVKPGVDYIFWIGGNGVGEAHNFTVPPRSKLAHWPFSSSGSLNGGSNGAFPGILENGAQIINKELKLDGVDDYFNIPGGLQIPDGNGMYDKNQAIKQAITLSAKFKSEDLSNCSYRDCRIISKATGTAEQDHYFMVSTVKVGSKTRLRFRLKTNGVSST